MYRLIKISFISGLILAILGVLKFELPYSIRKTLPDFVNYFVTIGIVFIAISFIIYTVRIFKYHNANTFRFSKVVFFIGVILFGIKIIMEILQLKIPNNYEILFVPLIVSLPLLIIGLVLLLAHYLALKNYRALLVTSVIFIVFFLFIPIIKVSYSCNADAEIAIPINDLKTNHEIDYSKQYGVGSCTDKWKTPYMYMNNLIRLGYQQ